MRSISLAVCCKDEQELLVGLVNSLPTGFFNEKICLLDVDTKDLRRAQDIASTLFDRVHLVRFADSFGELIQLACRLCAPADYAFWMDCDERVSDPEMLRFAWQEKSELLPGSAWNRAGSTPQSTAFKVARARWTDWQRTCRIDAQNPDFQIRVVPTTGAARFTRRCHIALEGVEVRSLTDAVILDHFHDCAKDRAALAARELLYQNLCELEQISVEGGHPLYWSCDHCHHVRASHEGTSSYAKPPYRCMVCGNDCPGFDHKE